MSSIISRQPVVGLLATAIVAAISLFVISVVDFPTFTGPVAFCKACHMTMSNQDFVFAVDR